MLLSVEDVVGSNITLMQVLPQPNLKFDAAHLKDTHVRETHAARPKGDGREQRQGEEHEERSHPDGGRRLEVRWGQSLTILSVPRDGLLWISILELQGPGLGTRQILRTRMVPISTLIHAEGHKELRLYRGRDFVANMEEDTDPDAPVGSVYVEGHYHSVEETIGEEADTSITERHLQEIAKSQRGRNMWGLF